MSMTNADVLDRIDALEIAVQELRNHLEDDRMEEQARLRGDRPYPPEPRPKPRLDVKTGDVVLIGTELAQWAGCLARVHAVKAWGVQAWAVGPSHPDFPRAAEFPVRVEWSNIGKLFREIREASASTNAG